MRALFAGLALAAALFASEAKAADANSCGYVQGNGGWYSQTDRSGPYSIDGSCNATLIGSGSGGGAGGSVTQGTTPWVDDVRQLGDVTLGGATGWGTAPSGNVQGVNANVLALPTGSTTTSGALQPATAASGKITLTSTALSANTNTTIAAANTSRIAMGIQCAGAGAVNVSETGATLASATFGATGATLQIPAGTSPYFTPPIATQTAVTAYTATAQTCVVTEYNR